VRPYVDREDVVPQLGCGALESLTFAESDVGHHAVETAKSLMRFADEPLARIRVPNIGDDGNRGGPLLRAEIGGGSGGCFVHIDARHAGSFARTQHCDGTAIADGGLRIG
jgi:hypothetical protein